MNETQSQIRILTLSHGASYSHFIHGTGDQYTVAGSISLPSGAEIIAITVHVAPTLTAEAVRVRWYPDTYEKEFIVLRDGNRALLKRIPRALPLVFDFVNLDEITLVIEWQD